MEIFSNQVSLLNNRYENASGIMGVDFLYSCHFKLNNLQYRITLSISS